MVARVPLEHLVEVRILAGQFGPILLVIGLFRIP